MGYSNVAGDLNVYSTTSTQDLIVRGDTNLVGNLTSLAGFHNFGNVSVGNLVVTGNFTVTATNTTVSNALSINNAGTSTAMKVVQYEGGGPGHAYNVAEFWDFQTLAMVIDPEGNVAIHTGGSPGYAFTVVDGASIDTLTLGTPLAISSGGTGTASGAPTNQVFAGPSAGGPSAPLFRSLVNADLPASVVVSNVTANGSGLSSMNASNITFGTLANSQLPSIISVSNVTANGSGLSSMNASNLAFGVVAATQLATAQTNITSVGTLTGLFSSGNISAVNFVGDGNTLSNLNASNLAFGAVAAAQVQAAQTNITSVGTLTGLFSSGNITGTYFTGGGNTLSNLNASNLAFGAVAAAQVQAAQTNITSVGTLTGLFSSGNISAVNFVGGGNTLANLNASNLAFGAVAAAQVQAVQTNITSVGTLTGLFSSGNISAVNFVGSGNTLSNLNASNLAFGAVAAAQVQAVQTNVTQVGTLTGLFSSGNISAVNFVGEGNTLSNLNASNLAFGAVAAAQVQAVQTNITSVGTLTGLFSSGNISAVNFVGEGNTLSNLNASNLAFGAVAAAQVQSAQTNITSVGTLTTANVGILNVWQISNLQTLNVLSSASIATINAASMNVANIFTTNIVGFIGSQWTGTIGSTIFYLSNVGIGTSVSNSNLTVVGNVYVSNAIQTGNLIVDGVGSGGFLQAQGTGNVAAVSTIPIGSGGTNQTSYGTANGILYYDGTSFQAASGITASTATTLNVTTANITTLQTTNFIPASSGIFMNLSATYTLSSAASWSGNIAGTLTSNLYTLFAPAPVANWNAYGSSAFVNAPTVNGGIKFNQPGPYMIMAVIAVDTGIKTIALSSNTTDYHSNVTNVWSYSYRFDFGENPSRLVTIPVNVTNTSSYYYIDIETNNQSDNVIQTAYSNLATAAYTGTYVIIKPI